MLAGAGRAAGGAGGGAIGGAGLRTAWPPARATERRRAAARRDARAIANRPSVLLADEPTGNLDRATAERVFRQFEQLVRDSGIGALVATHNPALAGRMDRVLEIADGRLKERPRE